MKLLIYVFDSVLHRVQEPRHICVIEEYMLGPMPAAIQIQVLLNDQL